jgi:hypothetical protein
MTTATERVNRVSSKAFTKLLKSGKPLPSHIIADLQAAAIEHPDPQMRRYCLFFLDHWANDQSHHVFVKALEDEVDFVRELALHSVICENCRTGDLYVVDVVSPVARVLEGDAKPDLRIKALAALVSFVPREPRALEPIRVAARTNSDALVRQCAQDALKGRFVMPKKRYQRHQRKHASLGHGTVRQVRAV